jgi:hypothetical protein
LNIAYFDETDFEHTILKAFKKLFCGRAQSDYSIGDMKPSYVSMGDTSEF